MTLEEINERLDLLSEYLAYRIDENVKFREAIKLKIHTFNKMGVMFYEKHEPLLTGAKSFDTWLYEWLKAGEDNDFILFKNRLGFSFMSRKLERIW